MTTDEAIEYVAADMASRRTDWSLDECRTLVELSRRYVASNPQRFVDLYRADIIALERKRTDPTR